MSNYLLLGDLHLADRSPGMCTDSYTDDLFDMLEYIKDLAEEYSAVVIQAGDVFHLKTPSRNSHGLVQKTIEMFRKFPKEVLIVPGNHDLMQDRIDSLFETQPLGVVFKSEAATLLSGWHENLPVYGVPWLQRFYDESVWKALQEYRDSVMYPSLVVTHAPLYPPSLELSFEFYPSSSWAAAMGNRGSCYYGHVHESHGSWSTDGVYFCNQGSLSRGSLHEHNLTREIAVTLWNDLNGEFKRIPIPYKPADEVFKLDKAVQIKETESRVNTFLSSIGESFIKVASIEQVIEQIKSLDLDNDVLEIIMDLLNR